jgi:hypothetical protein
MSRDIRFRPILERIAANGELQMVGLTREAGALLVHAARLVDMPQEWLDGKRGLDRDIVESIALILEDALEAVRGEIENPTPHLTAAPSHGGN